jgi:L-fuconolactonase
MPSFPIIDAHVHLYDPLALSYPWMSQIPKLNRPHGIAEFRRLTEGVEIDGLIFVEVDVAEGRHLDEARWVEEHADPHPGLLRGIVASMPLERGAEAVAADLEAFAALPHARGVRRLLERHEQESGWALRAPFIEGVRLLARYNLPFDLCLRHTQLAEATHFVRSCPEVRFVVDHIAKPAIKAGIREPWDRELRELAAEPNVICKISGVVTEADHDTWTYDQVAPFIAHAIDCFGFDRIMFGGDWPVSELATSYRRWVDVVDRVTAGASKADLTKLYRENAIAFYRP